MAQWRMNVSPGTGYSRVEPVDVSESEWWRLRDANYEAENRAAQAARFDDTGPLPRWVPSYERTTEDVLVALQVYVDEGIDLYGITRILYEARIPDAEDWEIECEPKVNHKYVRGWMRVNLPRESYGSREKVRGWPEKAWLRSRRIARGQDPDTGK